jgi:hypothetical protein
VDIQPDRPKFVVLGLAHLQLCHPIKDFARVEIAKNSPIKLQKKWRMNRIAQIEQHIRPGEASQKSATGHADAFHPAKVMKVCGRRLVKQAIPAGQSMLAQPALKILNVRAIGVAIARNREKFEPDRVKF